MQELVFVAVNPEGSRREWPLAEREYQVGRPDGPPAEGQIPVDGDPRLSRSHFSIRRSADSLHVLRSEKSRNPLIFEGKEQDEFQLAIGQIFFAGKSQFGLALRQPASEFTLVRTGRERARLRRLEDCFAAVFQMLGRLRREAGTGSPWRQAFPVIRSLLPDVGKLMFLEVQGARQRTQGALSSRVLEEQTFGDALETFQLDPAQLERAFLQNSTVTFLWEAPMEPTAGGSPRGEAQPPLRPTEATLWARSNWAIVSPVRGLENSNYALCGFGASYLEAEALEEVATIIDVVAELVGHHLVIEQAAEYSSLLGVFGHHVGTLFKTSGALELWSQPNQDPATRKVLDRLLPIWGISQAISLHKKQGEQEWEDLIARWVDPRWAGRDDVGEHVAQALHGIVAYIYASHSEPAFLPWLWDEQPLESGVFQSLPPLADNPVLFDKTLALTIGLIEMLNNLRKYPEARGAGREDRRELSELADRQVRLSCRSAGGETVLEIVQPVVTIADGAVPQSRSLERIRALESRLLRGLVETGQAEVLGPTEIPHIVKIRQRWTYRWERLIQ